MAVILVLCAASPFPSSQHHDETPGRWEKVRKRYEVRREKMEGKKEQIVVTQAVMRGERRPTSVVLLPKLFTAFLISFVFALASFPD